MERSKFLSLSATDLLHGLFVAAGTALLTGVYDLLQQGAAFNWVTLKPVVIATVMATVTYLLKNLFTNSQNQLFKSEKNVKKQRFDPIETFNI